MKRKPDFWLVVTEPPLENKPIACWRDGICRIGERRDLLVVKVAPRFAAVRYKGRREYMDALILAPSYVDGGLLTIDAWPQYVGIYDSDIDMTKSELETSEEALHHLAKGAIYRAYDEACLNMPQTDKELLESIMSRLLQEDTASQRMALYGSLIGALVILPINVDQHTGQVMPLYDMDSCGRVSASMFTSVEALMDWYGRRQRYIGLAGHEAVSLLLRAPACVESVHINPGRPEAFDLSEQEIADLAAGRVPK